MAYRIAFASSDGKVINQHFGRTQKFLIVEIDEEVAKFLETRENDPSCQEFQHTEDAMARSISLISDCKAVYVAKIGHGAITRLDEAGIKSYETPYFIEDVIDKLLMDKETGENFSHS